jgi:hypothetical protein
MLVVDAKKQGHNSACSKQQKTPPGFHTSVGASRAKWPYASDASASQLSWSAASHGLIREIKCSVVKGSECSLFPLKLRRAVDAGSTAGLGLDYMRGALEPELRHARLL